VQTAAPAIRALVVALCAAVALAAGLATAILASLSGDRPPTAAMKAGAAFAATLALGITVANELGGI